MSAETLLTISGLLNKLVYAQKKGKSDDNRRIGKVRRFVFHPSEKRVIGFIVKRPDLALMFHRSDVFVALDHASFTDDGVIVDLSGAATDEKARARLGVEWAKCLLWLGMQVITEDGEEVGRVGDVTFEAEGGRVVNIRRNEGLAARWLIGVEVIPAQLIRGFRFGVGSKIADYQNGDAADGEDENADAAETNQGAIVVADEVRDLVPEGGLAQKAGDASARAIVRGKDALADAKERGGDIAARATQAAQDAREEMAPQMNELGEKAGDTLNRGAFVAGRQLGRASHMFADFMDEYRKARDGENEPKE